MERQGSSFHSTANSPRSTRFSRITQNAVENFQLLVGTRDAGAAGNPGLGDYPGHQQRVVTRHAGQRVGGQGAADEGTLALFAADGDSPLDMYKGLGRPLIVIAQSTVDPVWVSLKKSLEDPANKQGIADRSIKVYSVLNMSGQLDGKDIGQQDTMALIRALKLGAGALPKVILIGTAGKPPLPQRSLLWGREAAALGLTVLLFGVIAVAHKGLGYPVFG